MRLMMVCSAGDSSIGGCHRGGRLQDPPYHVVATNFSDHCFDLYDGTSKQAIGGTFVPIWTDAAEPHIPRRPLVGHHDHIRLDHGAFRTFLAYLICTARHQRHNVTFYGRTAVATGRGQMHIWRGVRMRFNPEALRM
jgi:hypothetical protein